MTERPRVHDLLRQKGSRKWLQLHVDNGEEAAAAVEAGIVILSCEADVTLDMVRAAAPSAFVSTGMAHGSVASPDEAVREGFSLLRRGADSIYCSHSPRFIEAMAREAIPVTGHVGLVPNKAAWTGYRAVGRTPEEAARVLREVKDLENAGAATIEVEVVPVRLAAHITATTPMLTMGMGCGTACDTQYLFSCDVLGTHTGHYPRHAKRYDDFVALMAEVQTRRVMAFRAWADDVASGTYPEVTHQVDMSDDAFERALDLTRSF
ncbi:3-methyl-2-oxobutanoate hydroxymethyltransferase [Rubellimicrobium aerolatum]|uniref:3-methyl-2-oxobutanoate hydroxymethyltransferase n=1 Tax=Rubellimicrobium aerolatum TaxID=490979 RepID=A0ABW0SH81_9RHOB|nr:3-methyl-2-oxobutanoate hydroxymethyltransferase [Rubellimicrobium aerolatum]MBP1807638.1 3-methyl-2-oxobutanoate hydroxymethyltransferase [Rubellimicrobium aerolatum]